MIHARNDYQRIQDPAGLIPDDEPVFLIRAKDKVGPATVRRWASEAEFIGVAPEMVKAALDHADRMQEWQRRNGCQVPDMPDGAARRQESEA